MYVHSVKLFGEVGIIRAAAADGTNALQVVVFLDQRHKAVHIPLHRRFVDDSGAVDAVLGKAGFIVFHHDRYGPPVGLGDVLHLARQIAADLSIHLHPFFWLRQGFGSRFQDHRRLCFLSGIRLLGLAFSGFAGNSGRFLILL